MTTILYVIAGVFTFLILDYIFFLKKRKKEIEKFSKIKTLFGDISYVDINSHKENVILFCTGGGVSFDSLLAFNWLKNSNFRVICINRSGYHGLPLAEYRNLIPT